MAKDNIYREPIKKVSDFKFDESVAQVFDDMVSRSIPLYEEVQKATVRLTQRFAKQDTLIVDIGCSTATTLLALDSAALPSGVILRGIDSSEAMISQAKKKLARSAKTNNIELVIGDATEHSFEDASVVIMNYTLQFIEREKRTTFLKSIFNSLTAGGCLILTEKVRHESGFLEEVIHDLYYDFKRDNGYSELELYQKREALEKVLLPNSIEENTALLGDAGFQQVELFLKLYPFSCFVAVKRQN